MCAEKLSQHSQPFVGANENIKPISIRKQYR